MSFKTGTSLIIILLAIWSLLWKCYSTWTASKKDDKRWFIILIILNTFGILDMIYVFGVANKKWSDVKNTFKNFLK
ncbi:DUF5652 family protein [Candidatus Nomurabacteria bacterium]|nr:DUF5652 family protein [Candidatus Nomurabacteria bacterium]